MGRGTWLVTTQPPQSTSVHLCLADFHICSIYPSFSSSSWSATRLTTTRNHPTTQLPQFTLCLSLSTNYTSIYFCPIYLEFTSVSPRQVDPRQQQKAATSVPQRPAPPSDADLCSPPARAQEWGLRGRLSSRESEFCYSSPRILQDHKNEVFEQTHFANKVNSAVYLQQKHKNIKKGRLCR